MPPKTPPYTQITKNTLTEKINQSTHIKIYKDPDTWRLKRWIETFDLFQPLFSN